MPQVCKPSSDICAYAITTFGEQHFYYCIEHKKFGLGIDAVKAGYVAQNVFADKLEEIYFAGAVQIFKSVLIRVSEDKEKPSKQPLALAMKATCDKSYLPERSIIDSIAGVKRIYEESSFTLVLKAFLLGCLEKDIEDTILIEHSEKYCLELEGNKTEIGQVTFLIKVACLLGKYYWNDTPNSNAFSGCSEWLLSAHLRRSLGYSKARRFLFHIVLRADHSITKIGLLLRRKRVYLTLTIWECFIKHVSWTIYSNSTESMEAKN